MRKVLWLLPVFEAILAAPALVVTLCSAVSNVGDTISLLANNQCHPFTMNSGLKYMTLGCSCAFYDSKDCSGGAAYDLANDSFRHGGGLESYRCIPGSVNVDQDGDGVEVHIKNAGRAINELELVSDNVSNQNASYKEVKYCQARNFEGYCHTENESTIRDSICQDIPGAFKNKIMSLKMKSYITCAWYALPGCGGPPRVTFAGDHGILVHDTEFEDFDVWSFKCAYAVSDLGPNFSGFPDPNLVDTHSQGSENGGLAKPIVEQEHLTTLLICAETNFIKCRMVKEKALSACVTVLPEYRNKIKSLKMAAGITCALYPSIRCNGRARVILGGPKILEIADLEKQATTVAALKCAQNNAAMVRIRDIEPDSVQTKANSKSTALPPGKAGSFIIFEHDNYGGGSYIENAMGRCVTFPSYINNKASSLAQWPGCHCRYWFHNNCEGEGGGPIMTIDSLRGEVVIPSLRHYLPIGSVEDSLSSVDCLVPRPNKIRHHALNSSSAETKTPDESSPVHGQNK